MTPTNELSFTFDNVAGTLAYRSSGDAIDTRTSPLAVETVSTLSVTLATVPRMGVMSVGAVDGDVAAALVVDIESGVAEEADRSALEQPNAAAAAMNNSVRTVSDDKGRVTYMRHRSVWDSAALESERSSSETHLPDRRCRCRGSKNAVAVSFIPVVQSVCSLEHPSKKRAALRATGNESRLRFAFALRVE